MVKQFFWKSVFYSYLLTPCRSIIFSKLEAKFSFENKIGTLKDKKIWSVKSKH